MNVDNPKREGSRPWTYEERKALETADESGVQLLICPVCGGQVGSGPGSDQWQIRLTCSGCGNETEWCWK